MHEAAMLQSPGLSVCGAVCRQCVRGAAIGGARLLSAAAAPHACGQRAAPMLTAGVPPLPTPPQQYEKNVRKGLLNDATIGLWDTAALQVRPCCCCCLWLCLPCAEPARLVAAGAQPLPPAMCGPRRRCCCRVCWAGAAARVALPLPTWCPPAPSPGWRPQEVRIPPGPRLLILAHIDQYRHILRPAMPVPKALPHE